MINQEITLAEIQDEIKREIAMRQKVYPQWIINGRISEQTADYRAAVLQSIIEKLEAEIIATEKQRRLFQ